MSNLVLFALMALIVFVSRYVFLEPKVKLTMTPKLRHFLSFTAPAVLTAIWAPIVFLDQGEFRVNYLDPIVVAAIVTTVVAIKTKHALAAVAVGMVCFYGLRWLI